MTPRKMILLVIALFIAAGTVMFARNMMSQPRKQAEQTTAAVEILVAGRDMPTGTLIKETDLRWQVWPAEASADNLIVKGQHQMSEFAGSVVRVGLRTGEPIMDGRIFKPGEQGFLAAVLEPGMRAISVKITPVTGVAGLIFPGDRVDVILTHVIEAPENSQLRERRVSETVVTNARVLALDQKTDDQSTEPKLADVATLEVSPKDAEKIALMSDWGILSLVLRSVAADAPAQTLPPVPAESLAQPQGIPLETPALPQAQSDRFTWDSDVSHVLPSPPGRESMTRRIQVLRGKDTSEATFDQNR